MTRCLITTADDFGLSVGVNEAVERAATRGILTSASLMVSGPEAADALQRARRTPALAVGLHLVVIEGQPTLPPEKVPDLVDTDGNFPANQLRLGIGYYFNPRVRRQLAAEIRAQFEAFRATGLVLDHANAHKHMHLHPTVGRMMIAIGRDYGLRAVRVPAEAAIPGGPGQGFGDRLLQQWCAVLRRQVRRAGMVASDQVLGLGWTGHMTQARVQILLNRLPQGLTEMYFHPAVDRDEVLRRLMPDYEHQAELAALMGCVVNTDTRLMYYGMVSSDVRT